MSKSAVQKFEDKFDKVVKYYFDDRNQVRLSPELMDQLERWKFIRQVYSSWKVSTRKEVVNAVMKEFSIDDKTAYRDVANAQRLYARLEEVNREFERIIRIEEIKQLRAKCIAKGDLKTAKDCDTNLIKIGGYDKELEAPPIIQYITNQLVFDPTLVGAEEIPNLDRAVKAFLIKKKKEIDGDFDDANVIEEELKNAVS